MKRKLLALSLIALTSMVGLSSCGEESSDKVNFHTGYDDFTIDAVSPSNGKINKPSVNAAGFEVFGFYSDAAFEKEFDFSSSIGDIKDIYVKVLKGEGTQTAPYQIESGLSLNALTRLGQQTNAHATLNKNITVLSRYTEDYEKTVFDGTFNGNGHTITLEKTIDEKTQKVLTYSNTGLFYKVGENGSVGNFTVVGEITGEHSSTGAITNYNYGNIDNVTTIGTEYHKTNGCSNGVSLMTQFDEEDPSVVVADFGTVGQLDTLNKGGSGAISGTNYGNISNCHNKMKVSATIGAGSMAGINYGTIKNCFNQGAIGTTGNNSVNSTTIRDNNFSYSYIGGMAGANFGTIKQCANLNQVFVARLPWLYNEAPEGQSDFCGRIRVGGIAGYNYGTLDTATNTYTGGIIEECVNYGRTHGDMQVGGIAGYSSGYVADCVFSGLIGGRNSIGSIVGWQPGDETFNKPISEKVNPGVVTNCLGISRVETGSEQVVYDENDNQYTATKLTNKTSTGGDSNISDYFKVAKYASNCVYHNNSGNINPIDFNNYVQEDDELPLNTCDSTTATMIAKDVYDVLSKKGNDVTNLWVYDESDDDTTAIVGIASSWQVYLNVKLAWQKKTITIKLDSGDKVINGVAGIDYINTVIAADNSGKYVSDWDTNLSGAIADRGLPTYSGKNVIWVTEDGNKNSQWDGLLKDNITIYPMFI